MNKILILLSCISLYLGTVIFLHSYYTRQITALRIKNDNLIAAKNIPSTSALSLNDIYLYANKMKTASSSVPSNMYFTADSTPLDTGKWKVDVYLKGQPDGKADASDLEISFNNSVSILDLKKGDAFPDYPRIATLPNKINITGSATIVQNTIQYGLANKLFITIILQGKKTAEKAILTFDSNNSSIYFQSKDILDRQKSFQQVTLF